MNRTELKRFFFTVCSALVVGSVFSAPMAQTNGEEAFDPAMIERGKTAAVTCVACHQADGSGMNIPNGESWPRLTGLDRDYLVAQLQAFKTGTRKNASMLAFANMLNDDQMVDVATY